MNAAQSNIGIYGIQTFTNYEESLLNATIGFSTISGKQRKELQMDTAFEALMRHMLNNGWFTKSDGDVNLHLAISDTCH